MVPPRTRRAATARESRAQHPPPLLLSFSCGLLLAPFSIPPRPWPRARAHRPRLRPRERWESGRYPQARRGGRRGGRGGRRVRLGGARCSGRPSERLEQQV
ncbi:hypothetical protein GQ55_5G183900 [Panicum hallii var. hallii]|uniref:Uncharacterized protein n=1 Tax=Panicum hallii var. hallii TaxID=1504633 RepID=A0A2T7DHP6_9POAL|nr:hypothetical protein GQ55_5G183900 [Panicum hallii var. hallii]